MKQFYVVIVFLLGINFTYSQIELEGDWYLHSVTTDGNNFQPNIFDNNLNINFTADTDPIFGGYIFNGISLCNEYFGSYDVSNNSTIEILNFNQTLSECNDIEETYFEIDYFSIFHNDGENILFDYTISGVGNDATLSLNNSNNGDIANYGRQPLNNNILGEWFLHSVTTNNFVTFYNTFNPGFNLNFTTEYDPIFDANILQGNAICNGYFGSYQFLTSNTIEILDISPTLVQCNTNEEENFEVTYFNAFQINDANNAVFAYSDPGDSEDAILSFYNLNNGYNLTYGRQPLTTPDVTGTWYLQYLFNIDLSYVNTYNPNAFIEFSDNQGTTLDFNGIGACNTYNGTYNITAPATMTMESINYTSDSCDNINAEDFDGLYFYMFHGPNDTNQQLHMSVSGEGVSQNLTLCNTGLGIEAYYVKQPLSISEFKAIAITLKQNPVGRSLELLNASPFINTLYTIYSLDGKKVFASTLNTPTIDVEQLTNGIYFLKIGDYKTLKFIKSN
jgi:heat shock protein HslJ